MHLSVAPAWYSFCNTELGVIRNTGRLLLLKRSHSSRPKAVGRGSPMLLIKPNWSRATAMLSWGWGRGELWLSATDFLFLSRVSEISCINIFHLLYTHRALSETLNHYFYNFHKLWLFCWRKDPQSSLCFIMPFWTVILFLESCYVDLINYIFFSIYSNDNQS